METIGAGLLNRRMAAVYNNLTTSIAFYPIIISAFYLALVAGMLHFDSSWTGKKLAVYIPWLKFNEMEVARAIMTTLIAGIISLMALSFSMVMVVLNQATTTISPKVMQGLITRKEHQFVLGNQFGSILYFMILLLMLRSSHSAEIPAFSLALGLLLGFWSLGLFVYFIHNISHSIQVTNIVVHIHALTRKALKKLHADGENEKHFPTEANFETPYSFHTDRAGFLQEINTKTLMRLAQKHDLQVKMERHFMDFIPSGSVLFRVNVMPETLPEKDRKLLYDSMLFFHTENVTTNHNYGFTQLSEVAVKSLSPGINDPGIAVICVQLLSDLFATLYYIQETRVYSDSKNTPRLQVKKLNFDELFNKTISPIRHYGKKDQLVAQALLGLLYVVAEKDLQLRKYRELLNQHTGAILSGIKPFIIIPADAQELNKIVIKMRQLEGGYFTAGHFEFPA